MHGKDIAYIGLAAVVAYAAYTLVIKPAQQVESAVGGAIQGAVPAAQGFGTTLFNLTPLAGENSASMNLSKDWAKSITDVLNGFLNNQAGNGSNTPTPLPTITPVFGGTSVVAQSYNPNTGGVSYLNSSGQTVAGMTLANPSSFSGSSYNPSTQGVTYYSGGQPFAGVTLAKAPSTPIITSPTYSYNNWATPTFKK